MTGQSRGNALDHVIVVVFENRSLDNVLGRLYGPGDGKTFEGVLGKDLTNPIPQWAEHGADRKVVPYAVATDMDSPNPDSGEEYPHTNTQLFNIQNEANRFKLGEEISAPYNAPEPGQTPTMDGYVTDYISCLTAELGPAHLRGVLADHDRVHPGADSRAERAGAWVRGVRSLVLRGAVADVAQPVILDRGDIVGIRVNSPVKNFVAKNTAETIFNRLDDHGKTWKIYVAEPMRLSGTGLAHFSRLRPVRDARRAVRPVRGRCRQRGPARLLVHRAVPGGGPQRLPPGMRAGHGARRGDPRY